MRIFIASTNLHLINSLILNKKDILFFISKTENPFVDLIIKNGFFKKVYIFKDDKKISTRIKNSRKMISIAKELKPSEIITGNDRKIETSVLIHNFKNTVYSYMDDGLHSYILERQYPFKYSVFEKYLKMFLYKSKLDVPKYIGCSDYIKNAYLFKPQFANKCLKKKNLHLLDISKIPPLNLNPGIECENILLLPHFKFITPDIVRRLSFLKNFCVKYHPRDKNRYFNSKEIGNIPFEILLLNLNKKTKIYGFKTTALLIAKWLGFDAYNIVFEETEIDRFMKLNGIKEIKV